MANKYAGMGSKEDKKTRFRKSVIKRHVMCVRKRTFSSEQAASEKGADIGQRAYKCPVCKAFHLTSQGVSDGKQ